MKILLRIVCSQLYPNHPIPSHAIGILSPILYCKTLSLIHFPLSSFSLSRLHLTGAFQPARRSRVRSRDPLPVCCHPTENRAKFPVRGEKLVQGRARLSFQLLHRLPSSSQIAPNKQAAESCALSHPCGNQDIPGCTTNVINPRAIYSPHSAQMQ